MKKTKRLAILLTTAVMTFGAIAFSACVNGNGEGIEVTKEEWIDRLSFDAEHYDSLTFKCHTEHTFVTDIFRDITKRDIQAQINFTNQFFYYYSKEVVLVPYPDDISDYPEDINGDYRIVKDEVRNYYIFSNNDAYYYWHHYYGIQESSQEDFTEAWTYFIIEDSIIDYDDFTYNFQTNTYEGVIEGASYSIQFYKNGNIKINGVGENATVEVLVEKVNSTNITLPKQAKADLDKYLAEHAE